MYAIRSYYDNIKNKLDIGKQIETPDFLEQKCITNREQIEGNNEEGYGPGIGKEFNPGKKGRTEKQADKQGPERNNFV